MSLDLNKLENKLDEALSNETSETLTKFLNDKRMTNNKQQTEINTVEYLSKVNQFAKENNTGKPKQQTAVEWLLNAIETKNGEEFSSYYTEFIEQAKEMEKEKHEKFNNFLNDEKQLGISDLKTIERIQWYYNTYFNETYGGNK